MDGCGNLTIMHSLPVITNIAWKQNSQNGWMWKSTTKHSLAVVTNMAQKQNSQNG